MKKKLFALVLFGFIFIFSGHCNAADVSVSEQADKKVFTGIINDDSVNIRSGAGVNFEILRKMDKGELVLVKENVLDWYRIKLPRNSKAYVHKQFLRIDGNAFGYINANRVNVRAGKGTNFNVIGQLNKNDLVEIIELDNEWVQIFTNTSCSAWIHKDFVNNHGSALIYISRENANQEAWKLLQQAKMFEQSKSGITDPNEKRAACIQKYKAIIRDYPKTNAANSAKKYISMLAAKTMVVEPTVTPEKTKVVKTQAQPKNQAEIKNTQEKPAGNPIAQGKVIESGRFFFRSGTHKLIVNNQIKYFLKSTKIDLNTYIYHTVQIWGKIIGSDKTKIPTLEVEYVNQLN